MTLIEVIVVITIITILLLVFNSFYRVSKNNELKRNETNQLFNIKQFISTKLEDNYFIDWLMLQNDFLDTNFNPERFENNNILVYVPYITFVILKNNISIIENVNDIDINNDKLSIWLQKCFFIFNKYWELIEGENYKKVCDNDSILLPQNEINIQWFLAYNNKLKVEQIDFYDWEYKNGFFWYLYNIFLWENLIYNEKWLQDNWFFSFDVIKNNLSELLNNNIFIVWLKDQNNIFSKGVYYGNIDNLWIKLKNEYIIKYLNSWSVTLNDKLFNINDIFNIQNLNILYNINREEEYNWVIDNLLFEF